MWPEFTVVQPTTLIRGRWKISETQPMATLPKANKASQKGTFEDDFPFPQVGYVSSLEGNL